MFKRIKQLFYLSLFACAVFYGSKFYFEYKSSEYKKEIKSLFYNNKLDELVQRSEFHPPKSIKENDHWIAYIFAQTFKAKGDNKKALGYYKTLIKSSKSSNFRNQSLMFLAEYYSTNNQINEANTYIEILEKSNEKDLKATAKLLRATSILKTTKKEEALKPLYEALMLNPAPPIQREIENRLGKLNIEFLFSRRVTSNSVFYKIRPGDTLGSIATKFKTTISLIKKSNNLKNSLIRPNNHLKVVKSSFRIKISKSENTLTLYEDEKFFKKYIVGTGKNNVTPVGEFKITGKQVHPTWYRPDGSVIPYGNKENFLGTHWMSINYPGYGIHGTWDNDSLGSQSSAGCIRLKNSDIEEIFIIVPEGCMVEITD